MVFLILVSLFLASPLSIVIWQHSPLPQLVQFPWRFLALTAFAAAVLVAQIPKKFGLALAVLVVIFSLPYLKIERTFHPESYYTTNDDTTTVRNEYMPRWVKVDPTKWPAEKKTVYFPGVKVLVDGQAVEPEIDDNGIVKTPGKIIFTETPLRLFADGLTLVGILVCLVAVIRKLLLYFARN